MSELQFPQGKNATIVDDDGRIWRSKNPKADRSIPPKGREFYQKPDGSVGMTGRQGQKLTEYERLRERLPESARAAADSVRARLKPGAKASGAGGAGGGPSQTVSVPVEPGSAASVDLAVQKPSDLKTLDELQMKRRNRGPQAKTARNKALNDRENRVAKWYGMLNATQLDAAGDVVPKYGPEGQKWIQNKIDLETLEYQREAGTDGILTKGGTNVPGTESNPYLPTNDREIETLPAGDVYIAKDDPDQILRERGGDDIDRGVSPEVLEAKRQEFLKKSKPSPEPVVRTAGGIPKKPAKSEEDLKTAIEKITKALAGTGVKGRARVKMLNRLASLKLELKSLTE